MSVSDCPYAVLGVPRDALSCEIKRQYHKLALTFHPDKLKPSATAEERLESEERFKALACAWEVLGDPARRAKYDAGAAWQSSSAPTRSSRETFRAFFGDWDEAEGCKPEGSRTELRVELRWAEDIFNLPLFEGFLVLDPRPDRVAMPCVATSIGVNHAEIQERGWVSWFAASADDFTHDLCSPIIVLDDAEGAALATSLATFLASASSEADLGQPRLSDYANSALRRLRSHAARIWLVRGGTMAVLTSFPILCASRLPTPTPHYIAPGVFLGSRAVPWEPRLLVEGLGISHAIVAGSDRNVPAELPGIKWLVVDVVDDDTADMKVAWTNACHFIDASLAEGGQVYICVHGRSRSASFALAWLSHSHDLPVTMAAQLLRSKCSSVDWSLAYPQQILSWLTDLPRQPALC